MRAPHETLNEENKKQNQSLENGKNEYLAMNVTCVVSYNQSHFSSD